MMRNDYRRALILLRSNAPGYSGHVRLERRTLMGSMYFLAQVPADCAQLRAALVGRNRENYYACALGELRRDGRGQAVLGYSFDPRNLCGRELEQYQLIALTCAGDADCQIALYGNVCGHADMNWEGVRGALCALYADGAASAPEAGQEQAPSVNDLPEAEETPAETQEDAQTQPEAQAQTEAQAESKTQEEAEPQAESEIQEETESHAEAPTQSEAQAQTEAQIQAEAPIQAEAQPSARTAGELLGIDLSLPWPDAAEALRALFQTQPALEDAPDEDYVYIAAPLPEGSGYPYCAAGVRVESGAPVAVRYALPAPWTEEPPAGLENYVWAGDQNRGWWVAEAPL